MNQPNIKHHRKTIRIPRYDYSQPGYYLVTVCTKDREECFGNFENEQIKLSNIGIIAEQCVRDIPNHFNNAELDEFVVMPNHLHAIIVLRDSDGRGAINRAPTKGGFAGNNNPMGKHSLGEVIRWYKGRCAFEIHKINSVFSWQPDYYEHIIRNEQSLQRIREYIQNNPMQWELDVENPRREKHDDDYYKKIFGDG